MFWGADGVTLHQGVPREGRRTPVKRGRKDKDGKRPRNRQKEKKGRASFREKLNPKPAAGETIVKKDAGGSIELKKKRKAASFISKPYQANDIKEEKNQREGMKVGSKQGGELQNSRARQT